MLQTAMLKLFMQLSSPPVFYRLAEVLRPWLWAAFFILLGAGLYGAFTAPPDYQQGEGYRIIFVHVPAAWMSLFIYTCMAMMAVVVVIWRGKLAAVCMRVSAPIGASFTFLTLASGSLWGKPMWGTWWAWDARLTSELILLFLYLGFIALASPVAAAAPRRAMQSAQAGALLVLVGVINIPIIHFSVDWWNTLHQPATITKLGAPSMHPDMLRPLLCMALSFMVFYAAVLIDGTQGTLLQQEADSKWAQTAARRFKSGAAS